ncbi:MAG: ECF transporter S component [Ruminococcaceae bacterium]|nr:ECF transporter S component [Oscillospiraceae bacterium]
MSGTKLAASSIKKLVMIALFCALAYVTMFVLRIKVSFLTFDAKDAIITLAGLLFGPLASLVISLTVALIEMISVSDTGFWGFLMNFLSSAAFSCTAALIYKFKRSIKGAIIGLTASVFVTTAVMMLLNLIITPIYTGQPSSVIATMIPTLLFPFNLTKSVLNMALVLILYKPVSRAMKAAKVIRVAGLEATEAVDDHAQSSKKSSVLTSVLVLGLGLVLVAISVTVFIVVLGGHFALI